MSLVIFCTNTDGVLVPSDRTTFHRPLVQRCCFTVETVLDRYIHVRVLLTFDFLELQ